MSFTYIADYIRSYITKICNIVGQITCNIIKISNIIYYVNNYDESGSIWGNRWTSVCKGLFGFKKHLKTCWPNVGKCSEISD